MSKRWWYFSRITESLSLKSDKGSWKSECDSRYLCCSCHGHLLFLPPHFCLCLSLQVKKRLRLSGSLVWPCPEAESLLLTLLPVCLKFFTAADLKTSFRLVSPSSTLALQWILLLFHFYTKRKNSDNHVGFYPSWLIFLWFYFCQCPPLSSMACRFPFFISFWPLCPCVLENASKDQFKMWHI